LAGRPGRIAAIRKFLDHARAHDAVWFARRIDIAEHWRANHPPPDISGAPSRLEKSDFVARFGGVFEHAPWIAERVHELELGPAHDTATGLHSAMVRVFRTTRREERLDVVRAHPDLAGKLAAARRLTPESANEQASAGLDALTDDERKAFADMNARYVEKFGFPFIVAVRDHDKAGILDAFRARISHTCDVEFAEACHQVERIAFHRLADLL